MRLTPGKSLRIIFLFTLAVLAAFITLDYLAPAGRRLVKIRGEDPVNYFDITHSVLFDHDFNLNNEYEHMPPDGRGWTATQPATGLPGSPWGLGYSILEVPLLALGTAIDFLTGNPANGYSTWAVYLYCVGSLLMAGLGMAFLFRLLYRVASYWGIMPEDHQSVYALFVTFVIFFGTNVGYYAFSEMSHSSTFLFASIFLTLWWRSRDTDLSREWFVMGLAGGFLSICRWQDVLYLTGPLMYDLFGGNFLKRRAWWQSRAFYALAIGICWFPQLLEWKAIYGKYLTIPQGGGIFSFPPAHMVQVLFSSRVGWFIWTPVTILGVAGLIMGAFRASRIYLPWIIVLTLQTAVVGSVWFWHGAESFGARYMLSNTPLIGLGIMTAYGVSTVRMRRGFSVFCALCCLFTSLFALQFRLDLVPTETTLTFSELITDKFRLLSVRQRKIATKQALASIEKGDANGAIGLLESTRPLGAERNVDMYLERAYRAVGNTAEADAAARRHQQLLDSRLY